MRYTVLVRSVCRAEALPALTQHFIFIIFTDSDDQAIGHRHCTDAWPPSAPHHAHHGLRAAALPEAGQHGEDRPREDLHHSVLAGVPQAHDGRKLPGQLAGTRVTLTEFKARCRCCRGLVSFDLKSYNLQYIFHSLCNLHILYQVFHIVSHFFLFAILFCSVFIHPNPTHSPSHEQRESVMLC